MYGDDWDTTRWSLEVNFSFDYRTKVIEKAMEEKLPIMKIYDRFNIPKTSYYGTDC